MYFYYDYDDYYLFYMLCPVRSNPFRLISFVYNNSGDGGGTFFVFLSFFCFFWNWISLFSVV